MAMRTSPIHKLKEEVYWFSFNNKLDPEIEYRLIKFFEDRFENLGCSYTISNEAIHYAKLQADEMRDHYKRSCLMKLGECLEQFATQTKVEAGYQEVTNLEVVVYKGKKY